MHQASLGLGAVSSYCFNLAGYGLTKRAEMGFTLVKAIFVSGRVRKLFFKINERNGFESLACGKN